jgi:hypothetical protein
MPLNRVEVHPKPVVGQHTKDRGVRHQRVGESVNQCGAIIFVEFGQDHRDRARWTFSTACLTRELRAKVQFQASS